MKDKRCPKCGCTEIIEEGHLYYSDGHHQEALGVTVFAHPDALLFKGQTKSTLLASVCGSCGYAELYVKNPKKLLEAYRKQTGV